MADNVNHIQKDPDFVNKALKRQLEQFKKAPLRLAITEIEANRWKTLDDVSVDLAEGWLIENAVGATLDEIGKLYNLFRGTTDDDTFRATILIRAYSGRNDGTRAVILDILERSFQTDVFFTLGFPKVVNTHLDTTGLDSPTVVKEVKRLMPLVTNSKVMNTGGNEVLLVLVDPLGTNPIQSGTLQDPLATNPSTDGVLVDRIS